MRIINECIWLELTCINECICFTPAYGSIVELSCSTCDWYILHPCIWFIGSVISNCEQLMTIILIKDISWNFLQSCKHESWVSTAKYLMDDVPVLLRSDDVKDIDKVLNVVFTSLPSKFGEFIKWVAEVRRQEDGGQNLSQEEKGRLAFKVFVHFLCLFLFPL